MKSVKKIDWRQYTSILGLAILVVISIILNDSFLTARNLMNIARQIAVPGLLAISLTYTIMTGGIDLSVGGMCALTGVFYAMMLASGVPAPLAILLMLLFGVLVGLLYGFCVANIGIPAFIATLAGTNITKGLALVLTDSAAIGVTDQFSLDLGSKSLPVLPSCLLLAAAAIFFAVGFIRSLKKKPAWIKLVFIALCAYAAYLITATRGLPYLVLIMILMMTIFDYVLKHTVFGKGIYAVGGNIEVARMAGIKTHQVLYGVYIVAETMACLGGILTVARLGAGAPTIGTNWETDAIAATVIGGTSFAGGSGKLSKAVIGVLLIGVLNNMLSLLNVQTNMQMVCKGAIVLGAVILDTMTSKRK